jgi:hypothetical protein
MRFHLTCGVATGHKKEITNSSEPLHSERHESKTMTTPSSGRFVSVFITTIFSTRTTRYTAICTGAGQQSTAKVAPPREQGSGLTDSFLLSSDDDAQHSSVPQKLWLFELAASASIARIPCIRRSAARQ